MDIVLLNLWFWNSGIGNTEDVVFEETVIMHISLLPVVFWIGMSVVLKM